MFSAGPMLTNTPEPSIEPRPSSTDPVATISRLSDVLLTNTYRERRIG